MSKDKDKSFTPPPDIALTEVFRDASDGRVYYTAKFLVGATEQTATFTLKTMSHVLLEHGYPINRTNDALVQEMVTEQVPSDYKIPTSFDTVGWCCYEDKLVFKCCDFIGANDIQAEYHGNLDLIPVGDMEVLPTALEETIIGHTPLEFSFIAGLSGSMTGYLKTLGKDVPTLILSFQGTSSSGKSTCAKLAVSTGTAISSQNGKESLFMSANITSNAILALLDGNTGYTVCIDELAEAGNEIDFSRLLYSVSNCKGRGRCDSQGKLLDKRSWCTTLITTSEFPILDLTSKADGILVRVIPFSDVQWTESAEQADDVIRFCNTFHGSPVDQFSCILSDEDTVQMCELYEKELRKMTKRLDIDNRFRERAAKAAAIFRLTAAVANRAFHVNFDIDAITDFVLNAINSSKESFDKKEDYDAFMSFVERERKHFNPVKPNNACLEAIHPLGDLLVKHHRSDVYGYILYLYYSNNEKVADYVVITKDKFKDWYAKDHGNKTGIMTTLRKWAEQDLLLKKKGNNLVTALPNDHSYTSKMQINNNGSDVPCYIVKCNHRAGLNLTPDPPKYSVSPSSRRLFNKADAEKAEPSTTEVNETETTSQERSSDDDTVHDNA